MRVGINGAGVAGPALAHWLERQGHECVLFERAPQLRRGGYMIDFWGSGYEVAERMGLLPILRERACSARALKLLDAGGRTQAEMNVEQIRALMSGQYLSIARGDLAAAVFESLRNVEVRFGTAVTSLDNRKDSVEVQLSDGQKESFDVLIGADGLHSTVRQLSFGDDHEFECPMGLYVAAFWLKEPVEGELLTYQSYAGDRRQLSTFMLPNGRTLVLITFRVELAAQPPRNTAEQMTLLEEVLDSLPGSESVRQYLATAQDFFFDEVSQVVIKDWSRGRVGLLGDAAACISLLGGEGTGLALTEAYVLASELNQCPDNPSKAFASYQKQLQPLLLDKQRGARDFASFFAPKPGWQSFSRVWGLKLMRVPGVSSLLMKRLLRNDFVLPTA